MKREGFSKVVGMNPYLILVLIPLLLESGCRSATEADLGHRNFFYVGLGDRLGWIQKGEEVLWYEKAEADGLEFQLVEIWLTKDWDDSWVSREDLLKIIEKGYIPIIVHYYFGDSISVEYVEEHLEEWFEDIDRLASLIDINQEVWIVLEPEFNDDPPSGETSILEWEGWNDVVIRAVERIRQVAPKSKIGICAGDFGDENLELCLSRASVTLDFLSFQEMRASTSLESSSPDYLEVADSAIRFSNYLKNAFHKPILIAYFAISSYSNGHPRGWEEEQSRVIGGILDRTPELLSNGVFGLVYFEYYEDP
ncbi:hypothetical protein IIA15_08965, partial [candidate division TA06 bacterium]|nr:hypothetical protein [candidate division TA06 bacterium]